ncbi:MAG: hypothetical protein ACLQVD_09915 [Capsulimonadaceae bacterium]
MTLTIEIDESITKQLERKATDVHMGLSAYVPSLLSLNAAEPAAPAPQRNLGFGEGRGYWMAEDFDAPLDDFQEYM